MLEILAITGPIYFCIAVGFAVTRGGLFTKADMRVLGKFVINLGLPALLFNAVSQRPLREVMQADYLAAYALGSMAVLLGGYAWARYVVRSTPSYQAYVAMGMSCSNSGYMGYPVAMLALGPVAGVALALNMVVENMLKLPLLFTLAEADGSARGHWRKELGQTLGRLLKNPMIVAILLGFAYSLSGWHLPGPAEHTINLFAQASSALALSVIGGTLVGLRVQGMGRQVVSIAVGKLILHPLAVLLVATWIVPVADPQLRLAAVLFAAMPMLGIYPLLAQKHGHEDISAAALLFTTVASFFTLSGLLWLFKHTAFLG